MTRDLVIQKIHQIFVQGFEVESGLLSAQAKLGDDLGLDSLDAVDLVVALETEFGCRIPEETARSMETLQHIYDYVDGYLAQNPTNFGQPG